ncbi:MAG: pyridoxal phosphate-dependent decarboxylase family protein [Bacteroidota bacterium]
MKNISHFYSEDFFRHNGNAIVDQLSDYLKMVTDHDNDLAVLPINKPEDLYRKYKNLLNTKTNLTELVTELLKDSNHLHHPAYIGHQCAAPNPLAAIGSLIGGLLNNGSAVYEMGPANVAMERAVAKFFASEFSFPPDADGLFTSGGSLGNLTALLAARQNQTDYDIWEEGLKNGDYPVFMVPETSHYCIPRAVKIMGLGERGIQHIPVDENYSIRTEMLEELYQKSIDEGKRVIALTANACSTATGRYDNLQKAGEFCKKHNIWFHIDGAHGGAAILSEKYKHLLSGAELADSIVIDFHKMLMTPGLNTLILFRHQKASWATFAQKASYLLSDNEEKDWYNFAKRTMECTKSMMGLNVYLQLLLGGKEVFAGNIEQLYSMGALFAELCKKEEEIELALIPEANIVCFRYVRADPSSLNTINQRIRSALLDSGEFYIVQTELKGKLYLRVSLMNPLTRKEDLERLIIRVKELGKKFSDRPLF